LKIEQFKSGIIQSIGVSFMPFIRIQNHNVKEDD
jgi:hypothetical protein